jgi:hypothetical protein
MLEAKPDKFGNQIKLMKTINEGNSSFRKHIVRLARALIVAGFSFALLPKGHAFSMDPGGGGTNSSPNYTPLDSWSFSDPTNWTSDLGYAPVSFTNLNFSNLGDGASLVLDSTNPAWLQYNVYENDGTTNLTVDAGTVMFWFAPGSWSSTNEGGTGPGEYGRLLEVGSYTPDSSYGWWSIYVDDVGANLYFSTQTNDLSSNLTTCVSVPIAWTTNYFHFVVLTYSATNTALYLDGALATNGPPLTVYPGPDVLANGFYIGSDSNGIYQANGLFNNVVTYNVPLDADTIQQTFNQEYPNYMISPWNTAMFKLSNANSSPSTGPTLDVITGLGNLQSLGESPVCISGTNANYVWITNITATAAASNTMNVTFTIEGGVAGYYYDVFVTGALESPITNAVWFWMGQGTNCGIYSVNIASANAFLILGTPQDTDGDGLTDAYELLVSHTDPNKADTDGDGIPDGWSVLLGLNPLSSIGTQPSQRANYGYTLADWLNQVSGSVKTGTVGLDAEGNVQSVSQ